MIRLAHYARQSCRMIIPVALVFLAASVGQAASVLNGLRVGASKERTRLVFELDSAVPYQVNLGESSVDIVFQSLKVSRRVVETASDSLGGLVGDLKYSGGREGSTFHLKIAGPFYLRYFDLVKPTRVVVDLYPKPERPVPDALAKAQPQAPGRVQKPEETGTLTPEATPEATGSLAQEQIPGAMTPTQESGKAAAETPKPVTRTPQPTGKPFPWLYIVLSLGAIAAVLVGVVKWQQRTKRRNLERVNFEDELFQNIYDQERERQSEQEIRPLSNVEIEEVLKRTVVHEPEPPEEPAAAEAEPAAPEPEIPTAAEIPTPIEEIPPVVEEPKSEELPPEPSPEPITIEPVSEGFSTPEVTEKPSPIDIAAIEAIKTELQTPAPEPPAATPETTTPEVTSPEPVEEALPAPEEPEEVTIAAIKEELVAAWKASSSLETAKPEFNAEDGSLIWPVHLLDGGRVGRILVVDDEIDVARPVAEFLQRENYDVQYSTSSRQALDLYFEFTPDLLILDVIMPELSGVELVQRIREKQKPHKVIFMSGKTDRDNVTAAFHRELNHGDYEFFRKPVELRQIGDRVKDYFRSACDVLNINVQNQKLFTTAVGKLSPHQLSALHHFVWDKVFETSAGLLGRRIEPFFITDRIEPALNYMRRMGCMERVDYCKASVCIQSNPLCASNRLRSELEVMRGILQEFRDEYLGRLSRGIGAEDLRPARKKRKTKAPAQESSGLEVAVATAELEPSPAPRKTMRKKKTV